MNILIFNWRGPKHPNAGGAEIVTHEHAKAWVKKGHTVTLFTSEFYGAKEKEMIDGVTVVRKGSQVFGVQIRAFLWYMFGDHKKFDVVIDQFHGVPFFTPLYVKSKKIAFIHEVTKDVWKLNPWPWPLNFIPYIIGTLGEQWIFKLIYREIPFLTVSQSTKDDLIAWDISHENISVIHNGVTFPRLSGSLKKEKRKTIIFLGALSHDKGVEDAIYTFASINKKDPDSRLWMVGFGESHYVNRLKNLSKKLGVQNKITFWGYVSENKKFSLLAKAHVLLNSSVREGWGLVIIEAASQKTPAVVYNVPGLKDSVKDNTTGVIVKKRDPEIMAQVIMKLLNDKERYKKYQKNAAAWAKTLTWKKATDKSIALLVK